MELEEIYEPIKGDLAQVEERLSSICHEAPPLLREPLKYVLKSKGKRLRPAITLLSGRLSNFSPLHQSIAVAVELLHTATLVHDDIVDRSTIRRGKPTAIKVWGEGEALLLGDYLFAKSAELVVDVKDIKLIGLYCRLLKAISQAELNYKLTPWHEKLRLRNYFHWIGGKTAILFSWAAKAGAMLGKMPPEKENSLSRYGYFFGLAFQVMDDLLDFVGGGERRKPVETDLFNRAPTLPAIIFFENHPDKLPQKPSRYLEEEDIKKLIPQIKENYYVIQECRKVAEEFGRKAIDSLSPLSPFPSTPEVNSLIQLVKYTISRRW